MDNIWFQLNKTIRRYRISRWLWLSWKCLCFEATFGTGQFGTLNTSSLGPVEEAEHLSTEDAVGVTIAQPGLTKAFKTVNETTKIIKKHVIEKSLNIELSLSYFSQKWQLEVLPKLKWTWIYRSQWKDRYRFVRSLKLWTEKRMWRGNQKPEMIFPIKKRINTELFIGKGAVLHIRNGEHKKKVKSECSKLLAPKYRNRWEWETITADCFRLTWSRWE